MSERMGHDPARPIHSLLIYWVALDFGWICCRRSHIRGAMIDVLLTQESQVLHRQLEFPLRWTPDKPGLAWEPPDTRPKLCAVALFKVIAANFRFLCWHVGWPELILMIMISSRIVVSMFFKYFGLSTELRGVKMGLDPYDQFKS